jgi:hypothetical protein
MLSRATGEHMLIYLFCDESDSEVIAFSTDVSGASVPAHTPHTQWIFLETIDTLDCGERAVGSGRLPFCMMSGASELAVHLSLGFT